MEAKAFLDSFVGIVAVTGVFAIPIITVVALAIILTNVVNKRHLERMKMIEAGMVPPLPKPTKSGLGLLIPGAVLLAFGLAILFGEMSSSSGDGDLTGGLIFGLIGLALIGCF